MDRMGSDEPLALLLPRDVIVELYIQLTSPFGEPGAQVYTIFCNACMSDSSPRERWRYVR